MCLTQWWSAGRAVDVLIWKRPGTDAWTDVEALRGSRKSPATLMGFIAPAVPVGYAES